MEKRILVNRKRLFIKHFPKRLLTIRIGGRWSEDHKRKMTISFWGRKEE